MQTIPEVETQIQNNTELLAETTKRVRDTATKLTQAQGNVKGIATSIDDLKAKRQQALARGGDVKGLNDSLKKAEADLELESETVTGLQSFLSELQGEEQFLRQKLDELPKRILQLKSIELAASYNAIAQELASIASELNSVNLQIDSSCFNGKQHRVVFLVGDFISTIPKVFFDKEGLTLEAFIAKNPGHILCCASPDRYYEANVYTWATHRLELFSKNAG